MELMLRRPLLALPMRLLAIVLVLLATLPALAAVVGSPSPQPMAGDGLIAVDSQGDILVARPDGSDTHVPVGGPDTDINPAWSPDMSNLAFWSTPASGEPPRLSIVAPDGSGRRDIEAPPGWVFQTTIIGTPNIAWAPDGSHIGTVLAGGMGRKVAVIDVVSGSVTP